MTAQGKILWHTSMSLDGFVAGPDHTMDWMSLDWLRKQEGNALPPQTQEIVDDTGAILAGRNWHDVLDRVGGLENIYGGHWTGPVLVLTNRPEPASPHDEVTFVTGGIEHAVAAAREAANDKDVVVFGPTLATQCLDAGLLDEIIVGVVPVLLGDGVRFFGGEGQTLRVLEPVSVSPMGHLANLHYRVVR